MESGAGTENYLIFQHGREIIVQDRELKYKVYKSSGVRKIVIATEMCDHLLLICETSGTMFKVFSVEEELKPIITFNFKPHAWGRMGYCHGGEIFSYLTNKRIGYCSFPMEFFI